MVEFVVRSKMMRTILYVTVVILTPTTVFSQSDDCGALPAAPANTQITLDEATSTSNATISCLPGFDLIADRDTSLSCIEGDWQPTILDAEYCEPKTCTPPIEPEGTIITLTMPGVTTFGATASVTCSENYQRTAADEIITCNEQGQWSPSPTTTSFCQLIPCNVLPIAPENAIITLESGATTLESTATISCPPGFDLIAGRGTSVSCNDGDWQPAILGAEYCERKDCGTPQGVNNTNFFLTSDGVTTFEATAAVNCSGLTENVLPDPVILCNSQGFWEPPLDTTEFCQNLDVCPENDPCPSGKHCEIIKSLPRCVSDDHKRVIIALIASVLASTALLAIPMVIHCSVSNAKARKPKKKPVVPSGGGHIVSYVPAAVIPQVVHYT